MIVAFSAKRPARLKTLDPDADILVAGLEEGSFAVASHKKRLKQLMKSDADVVYDETTGRLYRNANGVAKGWGKKKVGGLIARFTDKPDLTIDNFPEMSTYYPDVGCVHAGCQSPGNGGTKEGATKGGGNKRADNNAQIAAYRASLTDAEEADLLVHHSLQPIKTVKRVTKDGKQEDYGFDRNELAAELVGINKGWALEDIELDAAAMETLFSQEGVRQSDCF